MLSLSNDAITAWPPPPEKTTDAFPTLRQVI